MDLPTYTNIWRIEKRLYKLYDFRLPAPLPITWIGVFAGITIPYVVFLIAVGLPFNHNLVWLYVLPPGVLTWLTTRPVIENKRLPELVSSQLRYIAEPRTWCRMAPFAEKDEIVVSARVWHRHPPKARPASTETSAAQVRSAERAPQLAVDGPAQAEVQPAVLPPARPAAIGPAVPSVPEQAQVQVQTPVPVPVPERARARRAPRRASAEPETRPSWSPWPRGSQPDIRAGAVLGPAPEPDRLTAWASPPPPPPAEPPAPDARTLEVAHDADPGFRNLGDPPASFGPVNWPSPGANLLPLVRPRPEPAPFPEAGPFPEPDPGPEPEASQEPDLADTQPAATAASQAPHDPEPGAVRRHLAGLRSGLGRKPGRSPGSAPPPAEAPGQVGPGWPQAPAPSPGPRPRWMLRAQPRPATPPVSAAAADAGPAVCAAPRPEDAPGHAVPAEAGPRATASEIETPEPEPEAAAREPERAEQASEPPAPAPERAEQASEPPVPAPEPQPPGPVPPEPAQPARAPVMARFVGVERERPLPSIERALSGPGSRDEVSWRRQVKVVAGGQGPGKRNQESLDRDRARLPLDGPRRIIVLGCTRGAGQTVTALMASHILAAVRGVPVAALDLNPGATSLAARRAPASSVQALLAGHEPPHEPPHRADPADPADPAPPGREDHPGGRLDVIADLPGNGTAPALGGEDFRRLATLLAERYPLTMIDPAPSGLTRVLAAADQLVLVAPASPDAATSLANTQQWLGAHGHGELAARAVTVVNGVSRRTIQDVLRAESVARGRCRAIVRVPWDDLLSARPGSSSTLHPQTRLAYMALAGVLVAGLAAASPVPGRNPGEHAD